MTQAAQKIGRNDPCPCGSGAKYKKCCLKEDEEIAGGYLSPTSWAEVAKDPAWLKIRKTEGTLIEDHLRPFVKSSFPEDLSIDAWEDFLQGSDFPDEMCDALEDAMFTPWFLFNWIPNEPPYQPIALTYLERHKSRLSPYEQKFIRVLCDSYYSFYVILDVELNRQIHLKDIFLQTEHTIKERAGTHFLKRGDVVFSRLLSLEGQEIFVGMGPYTLPANFHLTLLDVRSDIQKDVRKKQLTPSHLISYEEELRELFFYRVEKLLNPEFPILQNTDGDLIEECTLTFDLLLSPRIALEKLMPLSVTHTLEEVLEDASLDASGEVSHVTFDWNKQGNKIHKEWDNTIMGKIEIEGQCLTVRVNSEARAKKAKTLMTKHLGKGVIYKETLKKSQEELITAARAQPKSKPSENLNDTPEAQEMLKQMGEAHWESWLDTPLPILNNKTPRKAATTAAGREKLEALLLDFERRALNKKSPFDPNIDDLRQRLGLEQG